MDRIDKDEELVCPLCGGRLFWMPVSHIYACEHCKQSYSERNGVYMKKKRKSTTEKSSAVGNAAKLRDALVAARLFVTNCNTPLTTPLEGCGMSRAQIINIIDTALAEPVKNCEVGTPEEQRKRFGEFCQSHSWHEIDGEHCRASCPLYHGDKAPCDELEWAQMPYTESEATNGE